MWRVTIALAIALMFGRGIYSALKLLTANMTFSWHWRFLLGGLSSWGYKMTPLEFLSHVYILESSYNRFPCGFASLLSHCGVPENEFTKLSRTLKW